VRVLRLLGADTLIVTTRRRGPSRLAGRGPDLITDHIKLFLEIPLRGENLPEFGVRFPDCSYLYTPALCDLARREAAA
jgi:purine-nucleoside phosphorylase